MVWIFNFLTLENFTRNWEVSWFLGFEREMNIISLDKRGLQELSKTKKLGTPANLTKEDKIKGVDAI